MHTQLRARFRISSAAALVLSLALLAGCSKQSATGGDQANEPIKIGVLTPLSGTYASLGQSLKDGLDLYLEQNGGKLGGRDAKAIYEDDATDADTGKRKLSKLLQQDKVSLLMGGVGSNVVYAVRDDVHKAKIPFIVTTSTGNKLTRELKSPYIFRTASTSDQIGRPLGEWATKNGIKKVVIVSADYAAGRETSAAFIDAFKQSGGEILKEIYPKLGESDYAAYLTEVQKLAPDATFSFLAGSDSVKYVQQFDSLGLKKKGIKLMGSGFFLDNDVLPAQGKAAVGGLSAMHWTPSTETAENKKFVEAFRKKFNREADVNAENSYEAAKAYDEVLTKLNGNTSDKEAIVRALEEVRFEGPRGQVSFDKDSHQVIHTVYIREVKEKDGKLVNEPIFEFKDYKDPGK